MIENYASTCTIVEQTDLVQLIQSVFIFHLVNQI